MRRRQLSGVGRRVLILTVLTLACGFALLWRRSRRPTAAPATRTESSRAASPTPKPAAAVRQPRAGRTSKRLSSVASVAAVIALVATFAWADGGRVGARFKSTATANAPTTGGGEDESEEINARDAAFYDARAFPNSAIPKGAYERSQNQAAQMRQVNEVTPVSKTDSTTYGAPPAPADADSSKPPKSDDASDSRKSSAVPLATEAAAAPVTWDAIGPAPQGSFGPGAGDLYNGQLPLAGRVTGIATHPTDQNTVYIAAANGGVWKTTDGGAVWTPIFDDQPSLSMGAIAIDAGTPTTVWAGTGEATTSGDSYYGRGLFRSTNGGAAWSKIGGTQFDYCQISDIVIKPGTPSTILVSVGLSPGHPGPASSCEHDGQSSRGIWRSVDGGTTWSHVAVTQGTTDMVADPANSSTFYAGDWQYGFLRSIDSGATWGPIANSGFPSTSSTGRIELAVSSTGSVVYAAVAAFDTSKLLGLYRSANGGTTWTKQSAPSGVCEYNASDASGQCYYDLVLAVDPANSAIVYLGGIYMVRSTNSGVNWTFSGNSLNGTHQIHVDFQSTGFDAQGRLWVGTDGGIYRTVDGGTYTNHNQTLAITQFNHGISGSASVIVGGTQDNGTNKYSGGLSWMQYLSGDGGFTAMDPAAPGTIYSTYIYLRVDKSCTTNFGCDGLHARTLNNADCMGEGARQCEFYAPIAMDPVRTSTIYAGTKKVYKTTDGWQTAPVAISPAFGNNITDIAPAASSASVVYAGTRNGELRVTTDGGASWPDTKANGLPVAWVNEITVDPADAQHAYVGLSGFGHGHIYMTTNAGQAWTNISGNLPDTPVNAIATDQRTSPATLYVGTDTGVFSSADNGATWAKYGAGLPNTIVTDLLLDPSANKLVAATHGRSMYTALIGILPPTPTNGQIVFQRDDGNDYEIYLRSPSGGETQLTNNTSADEDPVLSPDGRQIAWATNRDGNYEIYRMNTDGTGVTRLTNNAALDEFPTWSNDGAKLAFDSNRADANPSTCATTCNYELYSMASSNGAGVTRLTTDASADRRPAWSPDGTRIAWASTRNGKDDLYVGPADGTGTPLRLTTSTGTDRAPAWSPNSTLIAYATTRVDANPSTCDPCNFEIFTLKADGTSAAPTRITTQAGVDDYPTWSPDGAEIAFSTNRSGNFDLWKASAVDGASAVALTSVAGADSEPSWRNVPAAPTVPSAPTIGTATPGNGTASVAFTPPVSNGGSAVTGYTVTASPGGRTATGAGSPLVVTGLTNGTSYRFTVRAKNVVGDGPESALSNAVVPSAPSGLPQLSVGDVSLTEGGGGWTSGVFPVRLSAAPTGPVSVAYATANDSAVAPGDYLAASGTLNFAAGEVVKYVQVSVKGEAYYELAETFKLNLSNASGAAITDATGVGTIRNDDSAPTFVIGDVAISEGHSGASSVTFSVGLTGPLTSTATVDFATADGTAVAPGDYTAKTGTLSFAPGQISKTVQIALKADTLDEPNESFVVNLSNATVATIADGQGSAQIRDDDPGAAGARLTVSDTTLVEGTDGSPAAQFVVRLASPTTDPVSVGYATADGTGTSADYVPVSGTLNFAAGEVAKTVTVTVRGDIADEPNETFTLNLASPSGATIDDASGVGKILDDDVAAKLVVGDVAINEGNSGTASVTFTIGLTAPVTSTVTVDYETVDNTAVAPGDYTTKTGSLTFTAGQISKTVTVVVRTDTIDESDERFFLNLKNATGATILDSQGITTVRDDD